MPLGPASADDFKRGSHERPCRRATVSALALEQRRRGGVPTDQTIYHFYEIVQIYGSTLKALVHEKFGDGIISAINFRLDIKKVEDPDGGHRAVITLDGKYLPTKPF